MNGLETELETLTPGWNIIGGQRYYTISFEGKLNKLKATTLADAWRKDFSLVGSGRFIVVFDALQMEDYDPMARITWQKALSDLKPKIEVVWVVTNSKLISAGASIMGLFSSITIRTASSHHQVITD